MMKTNYSIEEIVKAVQGQMSGADAASFLITELLTDSRKLIHPEHTLFFALPGMKQDGHQFIADLYSKGVRCFVVAKAMPIAEMPLAVFIQVKDVLAALQKLAAYHRKKFNIPVIAITGSNGKTVVKEWLYQLLHEDYNIVRSPKSFNSQIGVPLSLWQMNKQHTLGIFEAGISESDEMIRIEKMIQPTIGSFTHIGEAHS